MDKRAVPIGLAIFLIIITAPFWFAAGKLKAKPTPDLNTPVINQLANKACIEDTAFMRSSHMNLLSDWKEKAVRSDQRMYVAKDGRKYEMSLEKTCLSCHSNKVEFCDPCHSYAGIEAPNCWSCHVAPKEGKK
jgi:hypothetical protein